MTDIHYDRRVSEDFLAHFQSGGFASSLTEFASSSLFPLDLQLRRNPKTGAEHASFYTGLTAVLKVRAVTGGLLVLSAHETHLAAGDFDHSLLRPATPDEWRDRWTEVERYLERVVPIATASHGRVEGAVQAAVSRYPGVERVIVDREVTPGFRDADLKRKVLDECRALVLDPLRAADLGFGAPPAALGAECDALGIDAEGRVLAIEVKPLKGAIKWAAAQAAMYALVLQRWIDEDTSAEDPRTVLTGMLRQRQALGLAGPLEPEFPHALSVTPVVALQRGASPEMLRRLFAVRDVLDRANLALPRMEIYEVSLTGRLLQLDPPLRGRVTAARRAPSYGAEENARNASWKQRSSTLPEEARGTGTARSRRGVDVPVAYCLPGSYARYNLLPEVRGMATQLFSDLRIVWHSGVDDGPSNHLRSSQVQCVNALGQMVADPHRVKLAFGGVLDIEHVLDIEPGRHLTFEYIGPKDYFGEGRGDSRRRGANCTSVDAAFAFVSGSGQRELALVEWKYTECYASATQGSATAQATREQRYAHDISDPAGPVRGGLVPMDELFQEPLYQLVRQQLLARRLENDVDVPYDVVRVVHVLSPSNLAYERSYLGPVARTLGTNVSSAWQTILRAPDRFVKLDPAVFADPAVTSVDYCDRYADRT